MIINCNINVIFVNGLNLTYHNIEAKIFSITLLTTCNTNVILHNMKLINDLITLQKTEQLGDEKFAQKFGIHRMTWIRIKTGKTSITIEFLRKVIAVYPGLKKEAEKILAGDVTGGN